MKQSEAALLKKTAQRGDLWMIKTVYLTLLLDRLGIDVRWLWHCADKQEIYKAIERIGGRTNEG